MKLTPLERIMDDGIRDRIRREVRDFRLAPKFRLLDVERDYLSLIFRYEASTIGDDSGRQQFFCKIPKSRRQLSTVDEILDEDFHGSRSMGISEYQSLRFLCNRFLEEPSGHLGVIRPLCFDSKYNAIITYGVEDSVEVFELLRNDGFKWCAVRDALSLCKMMGRWLGFAHATEIKDVMQLITHESLVSQIHKYRSRTEELCRGKLMQRIVGYINRLEDLSYTFQDDMKETVVVTGVEVRNFITANSKVFFLDPGDVHVGSRYEDLSRFICSLSILYWGRVEFLRSFRNETIFRDGFVSAYEEEMGKIQCEVLAVYIVKQLIMNWLCGLSLLKFKKWSSWKSNIVQKVYFEQFFSKRIEGIIGELG